MRNLFRYPKNLTYLNSGSVALSPAAVLDRVQKEKEIMESNPTDALFGAWGRMWEAQKNLATLFNVDPKNLYLRPNVTYVMNDFLMALKLPKDSEILISDIEYGAIVKQCRYKAKLEGHTVKTMSFYENGYDPQKITEKTLMERLEKALTPKTKLVMLSHVMTGSGLKLPVEKMAKLLRSKGIFFAVDGAHGAGSCDLNFANTELDFYGSNLHKWLMGPKGSGFGYVNPRIREHLEPKFAGWTTDEVLPHFGVFGDGDNWTARWMICSTHNFSDFYGINETVNFWKEHGTKNLMARQKELADFVATTISETTGWTCASRFGDESLKGPLVAFRLPPAVGQRGFELMQYLAKEKSLIVAMPIIQEEFHMRISPHVYNTEEEIVKAADILKGLA